jgi:hypothetical protein
MLVALAVEATASRTGENVNDKPARIVSRSICIYRARRQPRRVISSYRGPPTRLFVSRLKNKPTRVNERRTTKRQRRFSLSTIPPDRRTRLPPLFLSRLRAQGAARGGERERVLSLLIPTPRNDSSSVGPFSSTASSSASSSVASTPPLEGKTRPSPGVELFRAPLGNRPPPPSARPPRVEIYFALSHAARTCARRDITPKQLVARRAAILALFLSLRYLNVKLNFI